MIHQKDALSFLSFANPSKPPLLSLILQPYLSQFQMNSALSTSKEWLLLSCHSSSSGKGTTAH